MESGNPNLSASEPSSAQNLPPGAPTLFSLIPLPSPLLRACLLPPTTGTREAAYLQSRLRAPLDFPFIFAPAAVRRLCEQHLSSCPRLRFAAYASNTFLPAPACSLPPIRATPPAPPVRLWQHLWAASSSISRECESLHKERLVWITGTAHSVRSGSHCCTQSGA